MRRKIATTLVAAGAASALALSMVGTASASDTTGVTKTEIVIGTTTALTGPASPGYEYVAPAAKAYFDYVNRNGGINGRKVKYIPLDDKYSPAETKKLTSQLILRDKIFAMFGALGTPPHSAVVQDLNRRGIPDVFLNSGYSGFNNPRKYPTTYMILPSYKVEAKSMAFYIENTPELASKKRCLFYQDGDFGEDAEAGFKAAGMAFDTTRSYFFGQQAAGFGAQMTAFRQAGCELIVFFGVTSATASMLRTGATLGYNPTYMVTGVGTDGAPRSTYLYHAVDNAQSMADYGSQAVVWQTAINPVVAMELLATGVWSGAGVLGPEAFDAVPFLDLLAAYGSPHAMTELPAAR